MHYAFDHYTSDILDKAHYKLFGIVDEEGNFEFEYDFSLTGFKKNHKEGQFNLVKRFDLKITGKPLCGGFIVYLHNYDKSTEWLKRSHIARKDIEALCGVSIYRDGIRILPYGEKGDDWLELDKRRIQVPTKRIGNDTIIGMIEIDQVSNTKLKDKTNREGLIENDAFHQFCSLVLATVKILEDERYDDRPPDKFKKKKSSEDDFKKSINEVKSDLSNTAKQLSKSSNENDLKLVAKSVEKIASKIVEVEEEVKYSSEAQKLEREILFNLAGTGLAAERFTHEFARLVRGANDALKRLSKLIDIGSAKIKKEVDIIYSSLEALRNDIRLLGPMFYVKKVANEKELDIKQVIQNTIYLQEQWLNKESIKIELLGDTFIVKMREGSCMQIFNNLIDNSIFWLSRKSELDRRKIRIILDSTSPSAYVSDSGPGVIPRYNDKIFDPFFTMKTENGRGLGLYIVKEILEEKHWDITLISKDDYPDLLEGASFKITFSENRNG